MNKYGKIAVGEIIILVVSIIAFAYMVGIANIGLVSAEGKVNEKCRANPPLCDGTMNCEDGVCRGSVGGGLTGVGGLVGTVGGLANLRKTPPKVGGTPDGTHNSAAPNPGAKIKPNPTPGTPQKSSLPKISDKVNLDNRRGGTEGLPRDVNGNLQLSGSTKTSGGKTYYQVGNTQTWVTADGKTQLNFAGKGGWGAIGTSLLWAVGIGLVVRLVAPMFGANEDQANALAISIGAGVFVGRTISQLATKGIIQQGNWFARPGTAIGFGIGVAVVLILILYKIPGTKKVKFDCKTWQAPTGGKNCEMCNDFHGLPCSEYQCKSLGQSCELLNLGTKKEKCAWVNPKDVKPPVITTWDSALLEGYEYSPDEAINPPDRGVRIIAPTDDECLPAFTPLEFGITTNEPALCKLSLKRGRNFTGMEQFFGGEELYLYEHEQTMALPGMANAEQDNITLENDGEFELYLRCQDKNGNVNEADFVFKFCVAKGPDTTPVVVIDTSILNGMPVAVGQDSVPFELYINEPAECKWSTRDKDYINMENVMDCSRADNISDAVEVNSRLVYTCNTTLEGVKDKQDNLFYFRCKDQPRLSENKSWDRNINAESYEMKIIGTQELVMDDAGPNGTVSDSTEAVRVTLTAETSAGFSEGDAICYYRDVNSNEENYIEFFDTGSYVHSTDLYLAEEDYEYLIRCVDLGGNKDEWQVNFTVESDAGAPVITRAYKEENYLKITTNEEAICVYDSLSCTYLFEDGIPMSSNEKSENHFTDWSIKTKFYIKCRDDFGNQPPSDECSAIVRPI